MNKRTGRTPAFNEQEWAAAMAAAVAEIDETGRDLVATHTTLAIQRSGEE